LEKQAMLKVSNLVAGYKGVPMIKGISFEVKQGEIVTLIGSNGSGKTTTMKALTALIPIMEGEIQFQGKVINKLRTPQLVSTGLVLCPEGRKLFPNMTVLENLEMGAYSNKSSDSIASGLDKVFGLFPRLKEREKQLAGTLSGGEQQMLAVGRSLMSNPTLLALDEPSLGLAPLMVEALFEVLKEINKQGISILLIEQNARKALELAENAYVLESGRIVLSGSSKELIHNKDVERVFLGVD